MGTPDRPQARLARESRDYPAELLDLPDPPAALFVRGAWPGPPRVAIVGSRAASAYGVRLARRLARDLSGLGFAIVSGLARGIDAAAHAGALEAGRPTLAVLPGSLDRITPPSHAALAERIMERGALAAEWEAGRAPYRGTFLRRNRLIAALASATVVVEAAARSGALATARIARRLGRPVLAVPGDVDRETSHGCIGLLRSGAAVCASAADVVAAVGGIGPGLEVGGSATVSPSCSATERVLASAGEHAPSDTLRLAGCLEPEPRALEALARAGGITVDRALAALLELEWSGIAVSHPGQRWSSSTERESA